MNQVTFNDDDFVLFTDIDGVVNDQYLFDMHPELLSAISGILKELYPCHPKNTLYSDQQRKKACTYFFSTTAMENFNTLPDKIKNFKIVLSSSWRTDLKGNNHTFDEIKDIFQIYKVFSDHIVDCTPVPGSLSRQEIAENCCHEDHTIISLFDDLSSDVNKYQCRASEINWYIKKHGIKHFAIVDDVDDTQVTKMNKRRGGLHLRITFPDHFVCVNSKQLLSNDNINDIVNIYKESIAGHDIIKKLGKLAIDTNSDAGYYYNK